jgi:Tetratricopeptide repeat
MSGSRRFAFLPLLASLALAPPASSLTGDDQARAGDLVRQGDSFFKACHYREALAAYEKARALDPGDVGLLKLVASSRAAFCAPSSKDPSNVQCLAKAIAEYEEYLAKEPDDEKAAMFLVTLSAEKYDDAIAYVKNFITKHPKDSQALQTVAMLYSKKGDYENSIHWQKKRAELEPNNAEVFYTMGVTAWDKSYNAPAAGVSREHGLTPEKRKEILAFGMASLDKAIQLNPDYFEAMLYKNLIYREDMKLEPDAAKQARLKANAEEWQKKALETRKARQSP